MLEDHENAEIARLRDGYKIEEVRKNLDKMAGNVVKLLLSKEMKISFAESCTGGLLAQILTSVSGASQVFDMGVCAYANRIKQEFLGVPAQVLEEYGAVSAQTALWMARGIKKLSGADIGVSVTGIAGPTGGTKEKPVGTVYAGICYGGYESSDLLRLFELEDKSRENIRLNTALSVFGKLTEVLGDQTK